MLILPSILSANWSNFETAIAMCENAGASHLHFDVMDGHFVPPITFGSKFVNDIRTKTKLFFDIHLMVQNPQCYVYDFVQAGANMITFHIEAEQFSFRCIKAIRDEGLKVGIALNPQTPISAIQSILGQVDVVLIMTVEPGFGGQKFVSPMIEKIQELHRLRNTYKYSFLISVDGGIDENNIIELYCYGVDWFVMGSCFFSQKNKKSFLEKLYSLSANK